MKPTTQLKSVVSMNGIVKHCKVCGEQVEFTRRAARNWETIDYCSASCRRTGMARERKTVAATGYETASLSA